MTYIIAELGHNWAPDVDVALTMVERAAEAGADAVKIQCRTLPDAIPREQRDAPKVVPWSGETMSYLDYRRLCELGDEDISRLQRRAWVCDVALGASLWDAGQARRFTDDWDGYPLDFVKVASASITDRETVAHLADVAVAGGVPLVMSTGGADWDIIDRAVDVVPTDTELWLMHCTSTYPCPPEHAHVRVIPAMRARYASRVSRVGFSNHCVSIHPTLAAIALGADVVEVHFTLDRSLPGTDQSASIEPAGLRKIVQAAGTVRAALGKACKDIQPGELEVMRKLRRVS